MLYLIEEDKNWKKRSKKQ